MSKHCPSNEIFSAYAEHRISREKEREFQRHLADCDICRKQAAILMQLAGREAPDSVPAGAETALKAAIVSRLSKRPPRRVRRRRIAPSPSPSRKGFWAAAAVVLCTLSAMLIGLSLHQPSLPDDPPSLSRTPLSLPAPLPKTPSEPDRPEPLSDSEFVAPEPDLTDESVEIVPLAAPPSKPPEKAEISPVVTVPPPPIPEPEQKSEPAPPLAARDKKTTTKARSIARVDLPRAPIRIFDLQAAARIRNDTDTKTVEPGLPVVLNPNDRILAEHGDLSFHIEGGDSVLLASGSAACFSQVKGEKGTSWMTLEKGSAILRQSNQDAWWIDGADVSLSSVRKGLLAVHRRKDHLAICPLESTALLRDGKGESMEVPPGKEMRLSPAGFALKSVKRALLSRNSAFFEKNRPVEKTILFSNFNSFGSADRSPGNEDLVPETGRGHRARNSDDCFLEGVVNREKSSLVVRFNHPPFPVGRELIITFRCKTNASCIRLDAPIEGKPARLSVVTKVTPAPGNSWSIVRMSTKDGKINFTDSCKINLLEETFERIEIQALRGDIRGNQKPLLLIDDMKVAIPVP